MKELPRKKSPLLRTTTRNEDQTMDQNTGLEAKISKEETRTLPTIDFGEVPPMPTGISLQDPTLLIGTTIRITEDHMINAQVSHSVEAMETGLEMDLSTTRMGTGEQMETFLVHHRLKEETSHKVTVIASQEVTNLTIQHSVGLTIDLRLVSHPKNKNFRRTIIKHHLMWFASPRPMIPMNELSDLCPLNF